MLEELDFEELDGVKLIVREDNVLAAQKKRSKGFEPISRRLWAELAGKGGTVVDAGAYSGFYSILAARSGADRVHAFEASPLIVPRLLANLALNDIGTVRVHPHALSRVSGQRIAIRGKDGLSSAGSIVGDGAVIGSASTLALDDVGLAELSVIKIDVERAEYDLLQGGAATIRRFRPHILIELLDEIDAVDGLLRGWGYTGEKTDSSMYHYHV
ncbi:FkbM family methyltransferase [Ancylobacter oerskovii]|uniref:FkbM family methyltransferase n=1 Tax=Ancylobacter oerskovii TaxID=459519 RepID=A0ABW4YTJ4_9HYPH|nr:FkbM family methyltransferase [Ancylobacter oerskovii]MBS7543365.1 FkbM family methyltransferase [Ancylobacter oerskovii]